MKQMGSCKYDYELVFDPNTDPDVDGDEFGMCNRIAGTPVDCGVGSDVADVPAGNANLAWLRPRHKGLKRDGLAGP
jgi:hypothetical protein